MATTHPATTPRPQIWSRRLAAAALAAAIAATGFLSGCRGQQAGGAQLSPERRADTAPVSEPAVEKPETPPPPPPRMLWMVAVGDIMLDRGVNRRIRETGAKNVLAKVREQTRAPYLSFANLECPLSTEGPHDPSNCCFRADPRNVEVVVDGGFDIVALANNHSLNAGRAGVLQTLDVLEKNGIDYVGAARDREQSWEPVIYHVGQLKVGFLSYTDLSFGHGSYCKIDADPEEAYEQVRRTKKRCDLLFVSVHWGEEYHSHRSTRQRDTALALVDAGADCILGHHPHTLQGIGVYKGRPILYSMGNFVFDQREGERMESAIFDIWWKQGSWQIKATPIWIDRARMGPIYPAKERAMKIARRLRDLSDELGAEASIEEGRVIVSIPATEQKAAKPSTQDSSPETKR